MFGLGLGRLGLTGGKSLAAKIMAMSPKLWLEPSTANYQDSAGTTLVTAPGTAADSPVGLVLDKSGNGYNALQSTSTARPVLSARKNFAESTEDFSSAVWGKQNVSCAPPSGGLCRITETAEAGAHGVFLWSGVASGTIASVRALPGTRRYMQLWGGASVSDYANFDLLLGVLGSVGGGVVATIVADPLGGFRCSAKFSGDSLLRVATSNSASAGWTANYAGDGVSYIEATMVQHEVGPTATPYQRVNTASDYDGAFPKYWKFDGVDDALATGNIDLTGTDKITVVAGVQNASSAVYQNPYGNGAANAPGTQGKFTLSYPSGAANQARGDFGGVSAVNAPAFSITAAPTVVTQILDSTTSPYQTIRSNGAIVATGWEDVGGQSFANAAIGMGSTVYGGGANPYAGRVYALLIFPRILTAPEIATVEQYVAQLTGVTL